MFLDWMEQPLYCSKDPCNFHCSKFWYLLLFDGSNNLSIAFAMGNLRIFNLLGGFLTSWGPTIIFTERKLKRLEYRDSERKEEIVGKRNVFPPWLLITHFVRQSNFSAHWHTQHHISRRRGGKVKMKNLAYVCVTPWHYLLSVSVLFTCFLQLILSLFAYNFGMEN